jgi:hypothetical protein
MWRGGHRAQSSVASAGCDLVGGIDHGPGSNQPLHHLQMSTERRHVKRSAAVLRYENGHAREEKWGKGIVSHTLSIRESAVMGIII